MPQGNRYLIFQCGSLKVILLQQDQVLGHFTPEQRLLHVCVSSVSYFGLSSKSQLVLQDVVSHRFSPIHTLQPK